MSFQRDLGGLVLLGCYWGLFLVRGLLVGLGCSFDAGGVSTMISASSLKSKVSSGVGIFASHRGFECGV